MCADWREKSRVFHPEKWAFIGGSIPKLLYYKVLMQMNVRAGMANGVPLVVSG